MAIPVLMPALSPTMTEGSLAKWLKAEGDAIESGDVIAEIETDKATMEVEAVDEGTLGRILVPAGTENVAVNETIAVILEDGESAADAEAIVSGGDAPVSATAEVSPPRPTLDDAGSAGPVAVADADEPELGETRSATVGKPTATPWPRKCVG